ncbi:hypothetical protein EDD18DRAFT_1111470 [Armillaria luteobubalina]|uniref:Uncharacterized protein n=1 Tax=Armillaria luteobubalina TaxID=153913 RepID=A0AA39PJN5_9AGAR|nr:hypothetical protein EDD18DRAFT_1111470 [Armillaria luteobubalina]
MYKEGGFPACHVLLKMPLGYNTVAATYNTGPQSKCFAQWIYTNDEHGEPLSPTLYYLDNTSPKCSCLKVQPFQWFEYPHKIHIPNYITLLKKDYENLQHVALDAATHASVGKAKSSTQRQRDKADAVAADHACKHGGFALPVKKAKAKASGSVLDFMDVDPI